jgi:F0F1-type ATP synthase assembly protein I
VTFYWIYDLQNWALCVLIIGVFVGTSLIGLFATRPLVRRLLGPTGNCNDLVSYFFAGIGVFYGLALGLIAVATWENYTEIDGVVSTEAAALASLYRDLDGYPQPMRGRLEEMMRDYTRLVIEKEWPAHKKGEALEDGDAKLDQIEDEVMNFEPTKEREKIIQAEVLRSLDTVQEQRRLRLQAVPTGLPSALWSVVLVGAMLNIILTYLFWSDNLAMHALLVGMLAIFIGLLVFLTAAMDNPFRGEFSISSEAFQGVLENVMSRAKA